jgi:hyaluronoglucosaminidase
VFGAFEPDFLDIVADCLPANVACLWTGPAVVPERISAAHVRSVARRLGHPLILWDNYPVNDLSMRDELHMGPLTGRDPRLSEYSYGYLSNPLLQAELSMLPLATCFDYARKPRAYDPERSWRAAVQQRFGGAALPHWRAIRKFAAAHRQSKKSKQPLRLSHADRAALATACAYIDSHGHEKWAREIAPWREMMERVSAERF